MRLKRQKNERYTLTLPHTGIKMKNYLSFSSSLRTCAKPDKQEKEEAFLNSRATGLRPDSGWTLAAA